MPQTMTNAQGQKPIDCDLGNYSEFASPSRLNPETVDIEIGKALDKVARRDQRYIRRSTATRWLWRDYYTTRDELTTKADAGDEEAEAKLRELHKPRCACCGTRQKQKARAEIRSLDGKNHYAGLNHCGGIWVCAVCADILRRHRAQEIATAIQSAQAQGMGAYLVTATLRHKHGDGLSELLGILLSAWRRVTSGKAYQTFKRAFGIVGTIKSLEITWSEVNSWHPHLHLVVFSEDEATPERAEAFKAYIVKRWIAAVEQMGGALPDERHGVDVRAADDNGAALGVYLTKVATGGLALELSRSDLKTSDESGSLTPFEFLDTDTPRNRKLFCEYAHATRGRSAIQFSRGLRDRLGLTHEKSDDEVLDELQTVGEVAAQIEADVWDDVRKDGERLARVLTLSERKQWHEIARLLGCDVREPINPITGEIEPWLFYYRDR